MIEVCVAGVPVEGAVAPAALVGGLEACVQAGVDVILLVRGGGSFEDLMPFNDESLARAVAACPVPVVTGIGHEPDTSIADMVSDFRASTPTAAAEAVAVSRDEIANVVEGMGLAARSALERQMSDYRTRLRMAEASGLFKNPMSVLAQPAHALDYCKHHLQTAMAGLCPMRRQRLDFAKGRLKSYGAGLIPKYKGAVNGLGHTFTASPKTVLARYSAVIGMDCARLEDLSPLKTLSRGYSVTKTSDGRVVKSVAGLSEGDILSTIVSDGCIDAKIERVKREEISVEFLEV
jgi:exodeoxyribonuclease VII large subunit